MIVVLSHVVAATYTTANVVESTMHFGMRRCQFEFYMSLEIRAMVVDSKDKA